MGYEANNVNELLYMILQKDEMAFCYLVYEFKDEIRQVVHTYLRRNYRYVDQDDFYQQAVLKLNESVFEYKQGNCSFHYFYFHSLRHYMIDVLRSLNTYNEKMALYAISLDSQIQDQRGSYYLMETISQISDPSRLYEQNLYHEIAAIQFELNQLEQEIVRLRSIGYSYQQIAEELHITKKKVDNTLAKVRKRKKLPVSD